MGLTIPSWKLVSQTITMPQVQNMFEIGRGTDQEHGSWKE